MTENPFAFQKDESEPLIRLPASHRRRVRHPHSIPVWGTFLLLLSVVGGVCFWMARDYYRRHYGIEKELRQMEEEFRLQELKIKGEGELQRAKLEYEAVMGEPFPETPQQRKVVQERRAKEMLERALWCQEHGFKQDCLSRLQDIIEDYPETTSAAEARKLLEKLQK